MRIVRLIIIRLVFFLKSEQNVCCRLKNDYIAAVDGIEKQLLRHSEPNKLLYFGELLGGTSFSPKMVGFAPMSFYILI